jgi:hypothetical protein
MARLTGLPSQFVDNANLRVSLNLFRKELLRSERRSIGRLDARFKGYDSNLASDSPDYDPSESAIRPPYTSTFNNYVRQELNYKNDLEYYILGGGIWSPWNWGTNNNYVDTSVALRNALAKNPYLKVFVRDGVLRYGNAVLCSRLHDSPHLTRSNAAAKYLDRTLRGRPHDVHRREIARAHARGHRQVHARFNEIGAHVKTAAAYLVCIAFSLWDGVGHRKRVVTAAQANGLYRSGENEIRILSLGKNKSASDGSFVAIQKPWNLSQTSARRTGEA